MKDSVEKLLVKFNGRLVGYLTSLDGPIAFQYDDSWINDGFSISPFSLPLSNQVFVCRKITFDGLFGVFFDSLPDGWGQLLVRKMLLKKGINPDGLTPIEKLSIVSKNGLGALEYEPSKSYFEEKDFSDFDELAIDAKKVLNDDIDISGLDLLFQFGGSSGGARPKAHICIDGEEWIVKFPCHLDPSDIGEREYNANIVAKKCGIQINECKLFPSKICSGYFGAKRFDRKNGNKIHMISLGSMLEVSHRNPVVDYCHLFQVISKISSNREDLYEAYRRMCFNVYYGNKDDHSKNFSFLYYEEEKSYRLSPAYDLTFTPGRLEHEMSVCGVGNPTDSDLLECARENNLSLSRCKTIMEKTRSIVTEAKKNQKF